MKRKLNKINSIERKGKEKICEMKQHFKTDSTKNVK